MSHFKIGGTMVGGGHVSFLKTPGVWGTFIDWWASCKDGKAWTKDIKKGCVGQEGIHQTLGIEYVNKDIFHVSNFHGVEGDFSNDGRHAKDGRAHKDCKKRRLR